MRIPDGPTRIGLVSALAGLTYAGNPVKVRDSFGNPDDVYPRVNLISFNTIQQGSKSQAMYESSCVFRISDRRTNVGDSTAVEAIADSIIQLLSPGQAGPYPVISGFKIWSVDVEGTQANEYELKPYKYIEKNLRISIKSEQL